MTSDGIPQLNFNELNVISHHLHAIRTGEDQWNQKENTRQTDGAYAWLLISAEAIKEAVIKVLAIPKLLKNKLVKDTEKWLKNGGSRNEANLPSTISRICLKRQFLDQLTKAYIKISCQLYINKIVSHHGWESEKAANRG